MPFLAKYFIKKKGKGFKERLQGKYKKRENTTEILEGELTFDVIKSAFPTGIYFLVVLTLILRRIAKLGCVAFTRSFVDLCFILTVHIVLNMCVSRSYTVKANRRRQCRPYNSDSSVSHTPNCCFKKISTHSSVYIRR